MKKVTLFLLLHSLGLGHVFAFTPVSSDSAQANIDIWLRANTAAVSSLEKTLQSAENQKFNIAFTEKFGDWFSYEKQYKKLMDENVDNWEIALFDARQAQLKFLKEDPQASTITETYKQYINQQIRWNYWHLLLAYPVLRSNANTKHLQLMSLPNVLLEGFDKLKVDDEKALDASAYRHFVYFYVTYFNSKEKNFIKYTDMGKTLEDKHLFAREHLSGKVYQYYLARLLDEMGQKSTPSATRNVYAALSAAPNTEVYTSILQPKLAELMAKKEEPKTKDEEGEKNAFTAKNLDNEQVSFKKFKGKIVYVDFWASWCGPCRSQFPFAKQLQAKLTEKQRKNIVFLYINIDDEEDVWRKTIEALKLEGYHLFSQGGWNSAAAKFFGLTSIPRYMLVDKTGTIIDANAKRPSDDFLINDLLKMLE